MKKIIAVVCGGDSSEHDVSLRSGEGVYSFFDKELYEVYIVVMNKMSWQVKTDEGNIDIDKNDFSFTLHSRHIKFNYAYITIHGTPGENGLLQGYLDMVGVPYSTSNVLVEALTFNKFACNQFLRTFGVSVADSVLIHKADIPNIQYQDIVQQLGLPVFVKPATEGSSFGVTKVNTLEELLAAIDRAAALSKEVMVETFLQGTEVTCGCYKTHTKDVVLPVTEVVTFNEFFDYDAKYNGQVSEITPARISEELFERVQRITGMIYDVLHCNGIIRIDYIISPEGKIFMLEVNTTPGMTATSFIPQQVKAAGMDMSTVLTDIVENQFQ